MSYKTIALGLLLVGLGACQSPQQQALPTDTEVPHNVIATGQDLSEAGAYAGDAHALRDALLTLYPSLDRFDQQGDVLAALDRLDMVAAAAIDPMTFYRAVVDVAVSTKDEHVIPFPPSAYRDFRREEQMMLPYTLQWVNEEPYLAAIADSELQSFVGQRVLAFDEQPAGEVLGTLRATIPSDGLSSTFAIRRLQDFTPTQNENYFDLNYPIWFGARHQYSLTLQAPDGTIERIDMSGLDWPMFTEFYRQRLPRTSPVEFRWLDDAVGYLVVRSFHDRYYQQHEVDAEALFTEIIAELNARPDAALILDLRQNEGGGDISSLLLDFLLSEPFLEYDNVLTSFTGQPEAARHCGNASEVQFDPAWSEPGPDGLLQIAPPFRSLITGANVRSPRENAFDGELVVLISGATGSAAVKVASVLDREARAHFVGEETGGAAAGATAFGYCTLQLPTSGISLELPLVRFERDQDIPYGRGVLPDVYVDWGMIPPVSSEDAGLIEAVSLLNQSSDGIE